MSEMHEAFLADPARRKRLQLEDDDLVTVCEECERACCWAGEMLCWESRFADTIDVSVKELLEWDQEHPDNWIMLRKAESIE